MSTEIKRILKNNEWEALRSSAAPSSINPVATLADIPTSTSPNGNQLLSGGAAYAGTGLDFDVTALTYVLAGVTYGPTAATTITLPPADPTNPRFDAIVVDDTETVSVIAGTPAASPLTPSISEDYVLVQYVLIDAGAITINITTENIYREGTTPDWTPGTTVAVGSPTADFTSTTPTPFQGSECTLIDFERYSTGRYVRYTTASPVLRADYAALQFRIYLTEDLTTIDGGIGRKPFVRLYSDAASTYWLGTQYLTSWGLQLNLVGQWQLITIPTAVFAGNPAATTIGQFRIHLVEYIANPVPVTQIAIDDIKLVSGYGPSIPTPATIDIQDNGTTIAPTTKLNFVDTASATVAVTEDTINERVDVEITATGGGGGGKNIASTQWGRSVAVLGDPNYPEQIIGSGVANGCTFFDNVANKDPDGTTTYNEWNITYGIEIEVTAGTTGTAQINVNGTDYQLNFTTDIDTSVQNWVTANEPLLAGTAFVYFLPTTTDWLPGQGAKSARIRFCTTEAVANGITFTPDGGSDWVANISNPFTGQTSSAADHILVPYIGQPYEGQRLHHQFRVNFEFETTGQTGFLALSLRRFRDDTRIGSDIQVNKNNDVGGVLETFVTYTNSATDPFVTGGFYFLLVNPTNNTYNFAGKVGILTQTSFEEPNVFP
jgi:hypothetical protein